MQRGTVTRCRSSGAVVRPLVRPFLPVFAIFLRFVPSLSLSVTFACSGAISYKIYIKQVKILRIKLLYKLKWVKQARKIEQFIAYQCDT